METISRRRFLGAAAAVGAGAAGGSVLGFDVAYATEVKRKLRIEGATVSHSVCPYCATGCALLAYTKKEGEHTQLLQIEGNPDSPVNEGCLCPKGASALGLALAKDRVEAPMYRKPGAEKWEEVSWEFALDRLAHNIKESRDRTFVTTDADGNIVNRCEGIGFAGGAAFSNEEGYITTKILRGLGLVHVDQQART
jgi:formate dehydrogenase major subunit